MRKYNREEMIEKLDKHGYDLLSDDYINSKINMKLYCRKGDHIVNRNWNNINSGFDCPRCIGNYKKEFNDIKELFFKEDVILLEKEYINSHKIMLCYCLQCKNEFTISVANWLRGRRCAHCFMKEQGKDSVFEVEVRNWIESIFDKELMSYNDISQIKNPETNRSLELDIFIGSMNKAIEIQGYYHKEKRTRVRDKLKRDLCIIKGIDLLEIWQDDWQDNKTNTKNMIKNFLD